MLKSFIFNSWETIAERNTTSLEDILVYVATLENNNGIPLLFIPMTLFSLFIVVMLGSYFAQRRLSGQANFMSSFAVAGYITAMISFFMSLIPGLINTETIVICVVIAIIGTILLLVSRERF